MFDFAVDYGWSCKGENIFHRPRLNGVTDFPLSQIFHPGNCDSSVLVLFLPLHCLFPALALALPLMNLETDATNLAQGYETYSFELLVRNDFLGLELTCPTINNVCACPMPSSLVSAGKCALAGSDVVAVSCLFFSLVSEGRAHIFSGLEFGI